MRRAWPILLMAFAALAMAPASSTGQVLQTSDSTEAVRAMAAPPRSVAFSDSDFFDYLATSDAIEGYRLDGLRAAGCDSFPSAERGVLDCFSLDGALSLSERAPFEALVDFLDQCTWVRARVKTPMPGLPELGVRFSNGSIAIDLIVGLKSMKAALSMPGQGAMVATIPEGRRTDLLRILWRIDPTNPSISKAMETKYRHDGRPPPTLKSLATGCDCDVGEGEFVDFEDPPAPVSTQPPAYPEMARVAQVQGKVVLHVLVDTGGVPCSIKVLRSVAYLDQAAIDAVKQWRFKPGLSNGVPLCVWVEVPIDFHF